MKRKNLMIGVLLLLAMLVSGFTFAYWFQNPTNTSGDNQVVIGEAGTSTVTIDMSENSDGAFLVPEGQSAYSVQDAVESITFSFDVLWTDNGTALIDGTLGIEVNNIVGDTNNLLNFDFTNNPTITKDSTITITIIVTMSMPGDQAEYDAIINAIITFDVTFTVIPN